MLNQQRALRTRFFLYVEEEEEQVQEEQEA